MVNPIKFPVPTNPLEDESLIGFVARACDRNGHINVVHALRLAGARPDRSRSIARDDDVDFVRLSQFFGCAEEDWRHRVHGRFGTVGFIDYFGMPIRMLLREPKIRRVAPAGLRLSPHHRAIWQLKPLHYCPVTGDLLISKCPNPACGRELRWDLTYGIQFCEFCVDTNTAEPRVDLRSLEPTKLTGNDLRTYVSIANLLNPAFEDRAVILSPFHNWPRWEVFDLVLLIAVILSKRYGDRASLKKTDTYSLPDWHANFMIACRAILGWPKAFRDVIELMREGSENRPGYYGFKKEVGDLGFNLQRRYHATARVGTEIKKQTDVFFASIGWNVCKGYGAVEGSKEWISFKEANAKYAQSEFLVSVVRNRDIAVHRAEVAKRAPVFFKRSELDALMDERASLICIDRLPLRTGFPQSVIIGLHRTAHIRFASGPAARFRLPSVAPKELEDLEHCLIRRASPPVAGEISLLEALRNLGAGEKLLSITRRCLDGDFRYSLADQGENILSRLMVRKDSIPLPGIHFETSVIFPEKMTGADIEILLDIAQGDIPGLVEQKCLRRAARNRGRYIEGASVRRLASKYISNCCLARRFGRDVRSMKRFMGSNGVRPSVVYRTANGSPFYLWSRSKLAEAFGLKVGANSFTWAQATQSYSESRLRR
jgi:hypothetical protein